MECVAILKATKIKIGYFSSHGVKTWTLVKTYSIIFSIVKLKANYGKYVSYFSKKAYLVCTCVVTLSLVTDVRNNITL